MPKIIFFAKKLIDILFIYIFLKIYKKIDTIESTTSYSDLQFLFLAARDGWGSGAIVEIGSYKGKSAAALALGSKCAKREKVFCIDPHSEGTKEIFSENITKIGAADYVIPIIATSEEASKTFNSKIRVLFIDGDHKYECVRTDILAWKGLVIDGGIIAFHDYYWASVSKAIDELIRNSGEFIVEGKVGCTLFVSKGERRNAELFAEVNIFNKVKKAVRPWKRE